MTNPRSTPHSAKVMLDALEVARDRARVQAHLFSLDAKKRWQELETRLSELESKLEQAGDEIAAAATTSFHEVTEAARSLLQELDGTLELAAPVRRIMNASPAACSAEDSLNRAAQVMWDLDCGAVPVVAADGSVVGIITDRDICMAAYTRGQRLADMSVESAMSKTVYTCSPADSIGHAARLMASKQVRRLAVTEGGKLVGFVALADIARDVRKHKGNRGPACVALADALASISEHRAAMERGQAAAE